MVNSREYNERIKQNQRLRSPVYLIAVSARLSEFQQLFGRSALIDLKTWETAPRTETTTRRIEAWKGVMSSYATLKSRAAGTLAE